jgi:hypothetical protein
VTRLDLPFFVERVEGRIAELQAESSLHDAASTEHRPLSEEAVAAAEARLGFVLPPALRILYVRVANGGFGPAYGLLGLVGGALQEHRLDAVGVYERSRLADDDPHWRWPDKLLPVVHLGCGMFFAVDCSDERGMVVWFEPNPHEMGEPWDDAFISLGLPFDELLLRWAAGVDSSVVMDEVWKRLHPEDD